MSLLHVCLGSNGDIILALPYLLEESKRIGSPVPLLVAKDYVGLLSGVSYVAPMEYDGDWLDLPAALAWLRRSLPECPVKVLQFKNSRLDPALPSFVDDQMWMAGAWKGWDSKPLVFDKRDAAREAQLSRKVLGESLNIVKSKRKTDFGVWDCKRVEGQKPAILIGTKGRSSPFHHSAQLTKRIRREFGKTHHIVILDKIKAHRVYDLLGLYDRAAALVSIDTLHLHLSRASTVPVFALSRDYPSRWHGTPHQDRFAFHCRYGDYIKREDEFMVALRETLEGKRVNIELRQCAPKGHYNPAIRESLPQMVTRYPHAGDWRTRLKWIDLGKDIQLPKAWDKHSHEDLRFFEHGGEQLASLTLSICKSRRMPVCVTAYGRVNPEDGSIPKLYIPKFGRNDFTWMEKNWVFFSHGGKVHAIYSCVPDHTVIELDGAKVTNWHATPGPRWPYGQIRGGTPPVPYGDGTWLRFFHSRLWEHKRRKPRTKVERIFEPTDRIPWRYYVGALVMEDKPPFRVLQVSTSPILTGDERWVPGCPHWKPNVVIPYGCVPTEGGWTVSLGVNDALACLATIKPEQLKLV